MIGKHDKLYLQSQNTFYDSVGWLFLTRMLSELPIILLTKKVSCVGSKHLFYQVHPLIEWLDGGRLVVDSGEAVDQVSAEGRVDAIRAEPALTGPVVGPCTPEFDLNEDIVLKNYTKVCGSFWCKVIWINCAIKILKY